MGDRFYMQQRAANGVKKSTDPIKQKRRLKKDIVIDISNILEINLQSLDRMTAKDLETLLRKLT